VKYIIVGYGNIGKKRKNAIKDSCVATVDPINKDADYKDYKNVDLNSFDAAVLTTPPSAKNEMLKYFLEKKKHVLAEKPLNFKDKNELDKISTLSKKNNVIWYTAYNHRFEPNLIKLIDIFHNGGIGKFFFGKITYGFGTAQLNINTWRDKDLGVIDEVGSHLINMVPYIFNKSVDPKKFKLVDAEKHEVKHSYDNCYFAHPDYHLIFHCSWNTWKNVFELELFGSKGSLHMHGLCKWGGSKLYHRKRVFPSGVPKEEVYESKGSDESWKKDFELFEKMIDENITSYENDLFMLNAFDTIKRQLKGRTE